MVMPKSSENAGRVRLLFVDTDLIQFNVQYMYIVLYYNPLQIRTTSYYCIILFLYVGGD